MSYAITTEQTSIKYGDITALNSLSLNVERGSLFGLIGPDGAGKSSIIRILATLLLADKGTTTVEGYDVVKDYKAIRQIIGYMPGRFSLYKDLSIEENLTFFATVYNTTIKENYNNIKDIYEQIAPFKNRRAGKLSGGMKQKLALCCALIHKPKVLLLDEPTTGVDAVSREEFWAILKRLRNEGMTIFVSTPYMSEATLCDRIGLLHHGNLLTTNPPDAVVKSYQHPLFHIKSNNLFQFLPLLRKEKAVYSAFSFGDKIHVAMKEKSTTEEFLYQLLHSSAEKVTIEKATPTIEDCFMDLTDAHHD